MSVPVACLACGHEGPDVAMKVVDLEAETGGRIRTVEVVQEIGHRHITEKRRMVVPERFGSEWRCRDRSACRARQEADR